MSNVIPIQHTEFFYWLRSLSEEEIAALSRVLAKNLRLKWWAHAVFHIAALFYPRDELPDWAMRAIMAGVKDKQ